jgi:lauroyl/myristoyl acyltransferase
MTANSPPPAKTASGRSRSNVVKAASILPVVAVRHAHGAGPRLHVSQYGLRIGIARIDQHGNTKGSGQQFMQEFQALCRQFAREEPPAATLPLRRGAR